MRASKSKRGNSRQMATKICIKAAVGPPCVHNVCKELLTESSSKPSCGNIEQRRSLTIFANLIPSFAMFPT